jgi:5'-nucleotidase
MRILITNDDGIHAPGLEVMRRIAAKLSDNVWVCAPETDQSGLAHSLTLSEPLRLRKVDKKVFALKGTPTDCVIMGIRELMDSMPDLVLSGVNSGQNIGDDVSYSGTVAGAMEGALLGIKAIAVSQAYSWDDGHRSIPWETVETCGPDVIRRLIESDFPNRTLVNVNFPNCGPDDIEGKEITRMGSFSHGLFMEKRHDGRGFPYYWLRFGRDRSERREGTDITALANRRISITPLKLDLTDEAFGESLAEHFGEG